MKGALFLDTSAWLAALNPRDRRHTAAAPLYQDSIAGRTPLVTTNLVVAEMHSLLTRERGAAAAVHYLDRLYEDPIHEVVWATRDLERRAVDRWLRPFAEHGFSLADAVSFQVMRELGMQAAFAFDRHFAIAGFRLVP